MRKILTAVAAAAALTLSACSGVSDIAPDKPKPSTEQPDPVDAAPEYESPDPEPVLPTPEDFEIDLTVLSEQCFGSAGCNVTFRITPTYVGSGAIDEVQATVIYEVTGAESPITNSFELLGNGTYNYQPEEMASTPSASAELSAEVVEVLGN